jgi:hypothetical protein
MLSETSPEAGEAKDFRGVQKLASACIGKPMHSDPPPSISPVVGAARMIVIGTIRWISKGGFR